MANTMLSHRPIHRHRRLGAPATATGRQGSRCEAGPICEFFSFAVLCGQTHPYDGLADTEIIRDPSNGNLATRGEELSAVALHGVIARIMEACAVADSPDRHFPAVRVLSGNSRRLPKWEMNLRRPFVAKRRLPGRSAGCDRQAPYGCGNNRRGVDVGVT